MRRLLLLLLALLSVTPAFSQGNECDTLEKCQEALEANPKSSLIHFRIGEIYFRQKNYQSAALDFSNALKGDLEPKWTEVWSRINLGKIFDIIRQRDRAVRQYELAEQTKDNTRGALDEAAKYLKSPYSGE